MVRALTTEPEKKCGGVWEGWQNQATVNVEGLLQNKGLNKDEDGSSRRMVDHEINHDQI